jgi:putative transposase
VEGGAVARAPVPAPVAPVPVRVEVDKDSTSPDVAVMKVKPKSGSQSAPHTVLVYGAREDVGLRDPYIMSDALFKTASHNPPHLFVADTLYMLTASIYEKAHLIESSQRKAEWRDAFHEAARIYHWQIFAWVVLHNHYHTIVRSPKYSSNLSKFINSFHKFTAWRWNEEDGLKGRKVWWNYWDTCIRSEDDYYNRLKYIFWNPVKHGLAEKPEDYSFSNYREYLNQGFEFIQPSEVNDVPEV